MAIMAIIPLLEFHTQVGLPLCGRCIGHSGNVIQLWEKGMKRDPSAFPELKEAEYFAIFMRSMKPVTQASQPSPCEVLEP